MSIVDLNEPTKTFSERKLEDFGFETNIGYVAFFINENNISIKKIEIEKIIKYSFWQSNGELYESEHYTDFSIEKEIIETKSEIKFFLFKKETIKKIKTKQTYKAEFYSSGFYSCFSPSNYILMEDIGKTKFEAVEKLITRIKEGKRKKREYSNFF